MDTLSDLLRNGFLIFWALAVLAFIGSLFLALFAALIYTVADVINRDDLRAGKLVWPIVILFVPFLGATLYWFSRPVSEQTVTQPTALRRATPVTEMSTENEVRRAA